MFIVYEDGDGKETIYPLGSFSSIKTENVTSPQKRYLIVGTKMTVRSKSEYKGYSETFTVKNSESWVRLGEYASREDRDAAFEHFILFPGVYESFYRKGSTFTEPDERIFQPLSDRRHKVKQ